MKRKSGSFEAKYKEMILSNSFPGFLKVFQSCSFFVCLFVLFCFFYVGSFSTQFQRSASVVSNSRQLSKELIFSCICRYLRYLCWNLLIMYVKHTKRTLISTLMHQFFSHINHSKVGKWKYIHEWKTWNIEQFINYN